MGRWRPRLNRAIQDLLDEAEVDYDLRKGKRHIKLFIGTKMVAVLPHGGGTSSSIETNQNVVSSIRRHLRSLGHAC